MKRYVLGFAFSEDLQEVLLINKNRPEWQAGLLNGIGGKVEPYESTYLEAMIREFKEECGINTTEANWQYFGTMLRDMHNVNDFTVFLYYAILPPELFNSFTSMTDEEVGRYNVKAIKASAYYTTDNLPMLLSMATCADVMNGKISPIEIKYN